MMPVPESTGSSVPAIAWGALDSEAVQWGMLLLLAAFSAIWITALGASVGSFLNVVVWRLPLGMSLVRPKSHCPKCGTAILARDNLPVIGWLRLRGKCRACGVAISSRYPLVEATTAFLFLGLAHFELFSGGANLPGGTAVPASLHSMLWQLRPSIIGIYLYHATLFSTLLCLTLIAWDGFRPPRRLIVFTVFVGFVAPLLLPLVHPVKTGLHAGHWPDWRIPTAAFTISVTPAEMLVSLCGLLAGAMSGILLAWTVPRTAQAADRWNTVAAASLAGIYLGWQAVVIAAALAILPALANLIAARIVTRPLPVTGLLATTIVLLVLFWQTISASITRIITSMW